MASHFVVSFGLVGSSAVAMVTFRLVSNSFAFVVNVSPCALNELLAGLDMLIATSRNSQIERELKDFPKIIRSTVLLFDVRIFWFSTLRGKHFSRK